MWGGGHEGCVWDIDQYAGRGGRAHGMSICRLPPTRVSTCARPARIEHVFGRTSGRVVTCSGGGNPALNQDLVLVSRSDGASLARMETGRGWGGTGPA